MKGSSVIIFPFFFLLWGCSDPNIKLTPGPVLKSVIVDQQAKREIAKAKDEFLKRKANEQNARKRDFEEDRIRWAWSSDGRDLVISARDIEFSKWLSPRFRQGDELPWKVEGDSLVFLQSEAPYTVWILAENLKVAESEEWRAFGSNVKIFSGNIDWQGRFQSTPAVASQKGGSLEINAGSFTVGKNARFDLSGSPASPIDFDDLLRMWQPPSREEIEDAVATRFGRIRLKSVEKISSELLRLDGTTGVGPQNLSRKEFWDLLLVTLFDMRMLDPTGWMGGAISIPYFQQPDPSLALPDVFQNLYNLKPRQRQQYYFANREFILRSLKSLKSTPYPLGNPMNQRLARRYRLVANWKRRSISEDQLVWRIPEVIINAYQEGGPTGELIVRVANPPSFSIRDHFIVETGKPLVIDQQVVPPKTIKELLLSRGQPSLTLPIEWELQIVVHDRYRGNLLLTSSDWYRFEANDVEDYPIRFVEGGEFVTLNFEESPFREEHIYAPPQTEKLSAERFRDLALQMPLITPDRTFDAATEWVEFYLK